RPCRVQAAPGPARATCHEPRLRQGPAAADHEPVPGLGRHGGLGPLRPVRLLNLNESSSRLGALRAVELECFRLLGERAPQLEPPGCARWAASAALAHAWRS